MLIEDKQGNQLLELSRLSETDLAVLPDLTHSLVVARHAGCNLLVFNRYRRYWELAGGLIDPGETPRACASRELREESGILCAPEALRFVGAMKFLLQPSRLHSQIHIEHGALFTVDVQQTAAFVANEEIAKIRWWDGREPIGEICAIDLKLTELV